MWSVRSNFNGVLMAMSVAFAALSVQAQSEPGAPISATVPEPSGTPTQATPSDAMRVEALDAGRQTNAELQALQELRRSFQNKSAEIAVLEADKRITELKTANGINNEQGDLPELVGVYQLPRRTWAEFLVGTAVLSASVGDWVTPQWRLKTLLPNGVVLAPREGGATRTLLFGRRSAPGGLPVPTGSSYPSIGSAVERSAAETAQ